MRVKRLFLSYQERIDCDLIKVIFSSVNCDLCVCVCVLIVIASCFFVVIFVFLVFQRMEWMIVQMLESWGRFWTWRSSLMINSTPTFWFLFKNLQFFSRREEFLSQFILVANNYEITLISVRFFFFSFFLTLRKFLRAELKVPSEFSCRSGFSQQPKGSRLEFVVYLIH